MAEGDRREAGFLGRWSRLKAEAQTAKPEEVSPQPATLDEPPPELPSVESLTIDSDFTGFLHPKVDENLRRDALRKLFSDPHFNVMDGLDVYIDDYTVSEPIPAAMLASMKQAQRILRWAEGHDDEAEDEVVAVEADHGVVPPQIPAAAAPQDAAPEPDGVTNAAPAPEPLSGESSDSASVETKAEAGGNPL